MDVGFLLSRQQEDGGFAEPGGRSDPSLTAWVVLALRAAGWDPGSARRGGKSPADYLAGKSRTTVTDLELRILALDALGMDSEAGALARELEASRRPSGAIGPAVNSTIWGVLALRAVGLPAGDATVRYLLRAQAKDGGWGWARGVQADSNDTAAALQALRAAGLPAGHRALRGGLAFLRRLQNADGGFELEPGRGSDAQSTAWAIQALLAAGVEPDARALRYLGRLRQPDGSFRYRARHATTPVWVTAQVLPALAGRPLPLQ